MSTALSTLLAGQTQAQIFAYALSVYQANGFPVQSWQPLGVERTRLMAFTTALFDVVTNYIPTFTGAGFLDYAAGAWLQLTAQELYNIIYNPETFTQGNILLTCATGVGGQTLAAGKLKATFAASGLSYLNTGTVIIPAGPNSVTAQFQAEFAGSAYADPSNSGNLTLTTPVPGVTLTNPASTFSSVTHTGSGTGTVTPTGSPTTPHTIVVSITATGQAGAATWAYSLDGAATVNAGSVASLVVAGVTLTLANGAINPSFVLGDTYAFTNPGSWITQQGSDVETDLALATRCRNRWASLSAIPTQSLYQLLATSTPSVGSQVTQAFVVADSTVNNKINIVVSGPGGLLPGATITAIQNYITPRARGCDNPVVTSPTTLAITIAGTVTISVAQLAAAQAAIQTALLGYVASLTVNGTLRLAEIIDSVMEVLGVVDFTGVTINGAAANLTLGGIGSYLLPAYPPTLNFTYVAQ